MTSNRVLVTVAAAVVTVGLGAAAGAALVADGSSSNSPPAAVRVRQASSEDSLPAVSSTVAPDPTTVPAAAPATDPPVTDTVPLDQRVVSLEGRVTNLEQEVAAPPSAAPVPTSTTLPPCTFDSPGWPQTTVHAAPGDGGCLAPDGSVLH